MRTITEAKTYNVYRFDELSEEVKKEVIEAFAQNHDDFWYELVYDNFCERMKEYGIALNFSDISFSGFYSQGDGASFTCKKEDIDFDKLFHSLNISFKHGLQKEFVDNADIYIERIGCHYYHENTVQAVVDFDADYYYDNGLSRIGKYLEVKAQEIEEKLEALKNVSCDRLYEDLENEYEIEESEEYIRALIDANDYEFLEDGMIYY